MRQVGDPYLNTVLIPALCKKAGRHVSHASPLFDLLPEGFEFIGGVHRLPLNVFGQTDFRQISFVNYNTAGYLDAWR